MRKTGRVSNLDLFRSWVSGGRGALFCLVLLHVLVTSMGQRARADIFTAVDAEGLAFISPDYSNTRESQFGLIGATVKSYNAEADVFRIDLRGRYAVGTPVLSYLNLKEIYFSINVNNQAKLHFGRKRQSWSLLDEEWNLGLFQPQFRWNTVLPETQGLTGVFWSLQNGPWDLTLFGSPLFIPDQGPSYELKDGVFQSSNPWFQAPPSEVLIGDRLRPIDYQVTTPNMADIAFQTSFGAQIRFAQEHGFFAQASGLYKPSHQLALSYMGFLVADRVKADVTPQTYRENIVALDLGYESEAVLLALSGVYLRAQPPKSLPQYTQPTISDATLVQPLTEIRWTDHLKTRISGFWTHGGEVQETGPDASPDRPALTNKFLYRGAYQLSIIYVDTFFRQLRYRTELQWLEVEKNQMQRIKSLNVIDFKGPWKLNFDFVLVETNDESTPVSNFRNLDQIWLGASYVF
jgi:hypothetical protein